ncbi:hypothetical protein Taro_022011, partial [Colocasia esculenta]|nr:hypothetical protein [Colocasia esculenta]
MTNPEIATGAYKDSDRAVRPGVKTRLGGQIRQHDRDGATRRDQITTVWIVMTRPQNAAYRAVAFTGSAPDPDRARRCSWIVVQNCHILTQGASEIENKLYNVAADEKGKKMSFLWSIHSSLATKNSSTRPQQVLKLVPR